MPSGNDPFTGPPLQPTTSNTLRSQTSQHSLGSNTSAASTRPRQGGNLFAPSLSRRPTSRAMPRVEGEILADSDSEHNTSAQQHRQRQLRRVRHSSPETKHSRVKPKQQDEEQDFVNRQPDGGFLLGLAQFGEVVAVPQVLTPKTEEEIDQEGEI